MKPVVKCGTKQLQNLRKIQNSNYGKGDLCWLSFISHIVVSHFGCRPLPEITKMAALAVLLNDATCSKRTTTPIFDSILNFDKLSSIIDISHYQKLQPSKNSMKQECLQLETEVKFFTPWYEMFPLFSVFRYVGVKLTGWKCKEYQKTFTLLSEEHFKGKSIGKELSLIGRRLWRISIVFVRHFNQIENN